MVLSALDGLTTTMNARVAAEENDFNTVKNAADLLIADSFVDDTFTKTNVSTILTTLEATHQVPTGTPFTLICYAGRHLFRAEGYSAQFTAQESQINSEAIRPWGTSSSSGIHEQTRGGRCIRQRRKYC